MPALVNNSVGSFLITMDAEGTMTCPLSRKKSRKAFLISALFIIAAIIIVFCEVNGIFAYPRADYEAAKILISARILLPRQSRKTIMKKIKYYYNTNTLRYEKLVVPLRVKLLRILGFLSAVLVTGLIIVSIAFQYVPSPGEQIMRSQVSGMREHYDELNTELE